jgi:hypothetical protein
LRSNPVALGTVFPNELGEESAALSHLFCHVFRVLAEALEGRLLRPWLVGSGEANRAANATKNAGGDTD